MFLQADGLLLRGVDAAARRDTKNRPSDRL